MATLKHLSSKNADYGAAEQYLTFEHDEFTGRPVLDEQGRLVPRQDYRISSLNCGGEDFAVACMRANLRYGKNQRREDVKSHHYILSFDPRDGPDHGLTMDKAQALGERFCAEQFPGHQALVCTHPDGHNHSGNIHVHIVINSLRVEEVERKPYMDRASDTQAGAKHRCTAAAMHHFRAEVMELCQEAGLYQIDLLGGSRSRVTEREYWAQKKGQLALDTENAAQRKPPTKFETDKEKLRREIRAVLAVAVSFEDFAQRLLQRGITVKESRGRLSYLTPDRAKPITARKLGDEFDRAAVGAALERNAARPSLGAKPSIREQLRQPQGVQRMVDIEAKKAQGKGKGYEYWATNFNLKQMASSLNLYTEYGFSSPEELDAAVSAAYAAVLESSAKLKPTELALKEKKELRRQIIIYRNTKAVREGLAAQKTPKARAAYRQEHEADLLRSEAAVHFFKANGITKLPTIKQLTAEIDALLSEKNAGYTEYQFNNEHPADYQSPSASVSDIIAIKQDGVVSFHYCDSFGFQQLPDFIKPENYLKNAEMAMEDDYGMIDGIINNGPKEGPTVAELEAQVRAGQTISLFDLANAAHRERGEKKSVMARLQQKPPQQEKKRKALKKSAEKER